MQITLIKEQWQQSDLNLLQSYGINLNFAVNENQANKVAQQTTEFARKNTPMTGVQAKVATGTVLSTMPAAQLSAILNQEKELLEPKLIQHIQKLTPDEINTFAGKLGCKNAIKGAIRETGYKNDELFVQMPEDWKQIALPIVLAKRDEKREANLARYKDTDHPTIAPYKVASELCDTLSQIQLASCDPFVANVSVSDATNELIAHFRRGLCVIMYISKSLWSCSSLYLTRNISVLDAVYGKGVAAASFIWNAIADEYKAQQNAGAGEEDANSGKSTAVDLVKGFSVDGEFDVLNPFASFRSVSAISVCKLWRADADTIKTKDVFEEDEWHRGYILKPDAEHTREWSNVIEFSDYIAKNAYPNITSFRQLVDGSVLYGAQTYSKFVNAEFDIQQACVNVVARIGNLFSF